MLPDEVAVKALERLTGDVDLMKCNFDGPLPPLPPSNSARGRQKMIMDLSDQGMTIRQIARRYAVGSGHLTAWGTAAQIADLMQEWLETKGCDGFNVMNVAREPWADGAAQSLRRMNCGAMEVETIAS
jgi:alkanesulfonate monooxygenase SsuD/methylene tetrahydromethanopterin reductase-like flavin-dependent oxidoreductase (luciferase family)